jgi:ribosomal protein L10
VLRSDKERVVAELTERLKTTDTLIVADYRGLTMTQIDELRSELLKHGARFAVVKNTLTRRAAEAAGADLVLGLLEGPTAIAFLEADGDPVAVAKALADAARTTRVLAVRGGVLDGSPITASPGSMRAPVTISSRATVPKQAPTRSKPCGDGWPRISSGSWASSPPGISTPASSAPRFSPSPIWRSISGSASSTAM